MCAGEKKKKKNGGRKKKRERDVGNAMTQDAARTDRNWTQDRVRKKRKGRGFVKGKSKHCGRDRMRQRRGEKKTRTQKETARLSKQVLTQWRFKETGASHTLGREREQCR